LKLLVRQQEGHPACKNEWWGAGMVWGEVQICILPTQSQLLPPPLTMTHYLLLQEIQIGFGFIFLVPAHPGSSGQNPESHKMVVVVVSLYPCLSLNPLLGILSCRKQ